MSTTQTTGPAILTARFDGKVYTFNRREHFDAFIDGARWAGMVSPLFADPATLTAAGFERLPFRAAVGREVVAVDRDRAGECSVLPEPFVLSTIEWIHGFQYSLLGGDGRQRAVLHGMHVWVRPE